MHSIVPIIMLLGGIAFFTGVFVLARFGLQQIKQVKFFGKEYKLGRFTAATVGSGILLILLSIIIHKSSCLIFGYKMTHSNGPTSRVIHIKSSCSYIPYIKSNLHLTISHQSCYLRII